MATGADPRAPAATAVATAIAAVIETATNVAPVAPAALLVPAARVANGDRRAVVTEATEGATTAVVTIDETATSGRAGARRCRRPQVGPRAGVVSLAVPPALEARLRLKSRPGVA